ncbi:hypothetical protein A6R68_16652 [Neotoma lepida]|uniref:Uncharacterized protein n=1 Tax=Neotoma lepida TaxID=56216 RepID=A0A1A6HF75_NEOLE|nr:hypothetical protein A6R68_16652 [Neotoma lepida]
MVASLALIEATQKLACPLVPATSQLMLWKRTVHTDVVPLDLFKCHLQVALPKNKGMFNGFSLAPKQNGIHGLAKGPAPVHWLICTSLDFMKFSKLSTCLVRTANSSAHCCFWLLLLVLNSFLKLPQCLWELIKFKFKPFQNMLTIGCSSQNSQREYSKAEQLAVTLVAKYTPESPVVFPPLENPERLC